jgi:hypothetical protein
MEATSRNYKDKLFINYFTNKERLIEAYNALTGSNYPPDTEVEFKTLENVLYQSQNNDSAFMIDGRVVVMMEHQSTVNENMPLRMLLYVAEIYKRLVPQRALYQRKRAPIPRPEFFVIYNGKEAYPDKTILRLSDAFKTSASQDACDKQAVYLQEQAVQDIPNLDLYVTVYNIAKGRNAELLRHSAALSHYSMFVSIVEDFQKDGEPRDEAIDKAIHYCRTSGIMGAYLENHREVRKMLITEWNDEEYREVLLEEGREEGLERGLEQGRIEIARGMKARGFSETDIAEITGLSEEMIATL